MHRLLLLFAFLNLGTVIKAQDLKEHLINIDAGVTVGNYLGGGFHLNYIYKQKLSFQLGFSEYERKDPSRPDDYNGGLVSLFSFGENNPKDKLKSLSFLGGLVLPYKGNQKVRWNLRAGMTYSWHEVPINYKQIDTGLLGINYSFEYDKSETLGIIIKPELEVAFSRYFGTGLAALVSYNDQTFIVGVELIFKLGFLRGKIAH